MEITSSLVKYCASLEHMKSEQEGKNCKKNISKLCGHIINDTTILTVCNLYLFKMCAYSCKSNDINEQSHMKISLFGVKIFGHFIMF